MNNIMTNVKGAFSNFIFSVKKHSPEILIVTGIVGAVAGTVLACKATLKVDEVMTETKEKLNKIHECSDNENLVEEYTKEDAAKDTTIVYVQTVLNLAKLYAPAIACGVLSITSILAGTNIFRKRTVALAAAYATVDSSFKAYRNRVIEKFGDEVDKQLRYNVKAMEVKEQVTDENGKTKTVTKTINVTDTNDAEKYSEYARFFDCGSRYWENNAEYNLMFLRSQQNYFNDKLRVNKHVFLNEVYSALGIPETEAGQVVGWIYNPDDPNHDNYIDFGIYDIYKSKVRDFVNGYERVILLDFNVDGYILKKIDWEKK